MHALSCAAGYNIRWLLRAITRLGLKTLFSPCGLPVGSLWAVAAYAASTLGLLMETLKRQRSLSTRSICSATHTLGCPAMAVG